MAELGHEQRRALQLLARSPNGCAQLALRGYGFKRSLLAALVEGGLATDEPQDTRAGRQSVTVAWLTITETGRQAIFN
jgi:hypothetical protein